MKRESALGKRPLRLKPSAPSYIAEKFRLSG